MNIVDTHCHYNLEPLYSGNPFCFKIQEKSSILRMDWRTHLQNALKNEVRKSIVVGPGLSSSQKAVEIANANENLYASVGIHPERINKIKDLAQTIQQLKKIATNNRVVAIGETGLDYYYLGTELNLTETKSLQEKLFIAQIELAKELSLPLILHVRDQGEEAYFKTLEILKKYWSFEEAIIFHCASGPTTYIKKALQLKKSYFGFDGNITFKNANHIREIFQIVQNFDASKILLETDAPYLAPEPYRGQICEPQMIKMTAKYLEKELGANLEEIYQNSLYAFHIA